MSIALLFTYFAFANLEISEANSRAEVKKWINILQYEETCFSSESSRQNRMLACLSFVKYEETAQQKAKVDALCRNLILEDQSWAFSKRKWLEKQGIGRLPKCAAKLEEAYEDHLYRMKKL